MTGMDTGYFEECLFLELKRPQNQVYKGIRDVEASDFAGFDGAPRRPVVRVLDVCQAFAAALIAPSGLVKGRGFNMGILKGKSSVSDLAEAVWDLDRRMVEALASHGVEVLKSYDNFHHWDQECGCRKPKPGMLIQASREWMLNLETTGYVGDDLRDCTAAWRAGCPSVLVGGEDAGGATRTRAASDSMRRHCIARVYIHPPMMMKLVFMKRCDLKNFDR